MVELLEIAVIFCMSCHLMPGFSDPAFPHWRRAVTATLAGALLVLARGFSPEAGNEFKTEPRRSLALHLWIWVCVKTYGTIFGWMNIHLPSILMFTRGTRFLTHSHISVCRGRLGAHSSSLRHAQQGSEGQVELWAWSSLFIVNTYIYIYIHIHTYVYIYDMIYDIWYMYIYIYT